MMKKLGRVAPWALLVVVLATSAFAWTHQYAVYDWWRLRSYTPDPEVVALSHETTMNDTTRRLFYVYRPQIESAVDFNRNCPEEKNEHTIILGCYVDRNGIYIFDVSDQRLTGIKQVTAAHELLHAAYARLDSDERQYVDELLAKAYGTVTDERVKKAVDAYRSRDPVVVPNELHSIIGTEVRNLPPELETYYKRYFNDRLAIVSYAEHYVGEFTKREERMNEIEAELNVRQRALTAKRTELESRATALSASEAELDRLEAQGDIERRNALVPAYNESVQAFRRDVGSFNAEVDNYNTLFDTLSAEYEALANERIELSKALNSRTEKIQL